MTRLISLLYIHPCSHSLTTHLPPPPPPSQYKQVVHVTIAAQIDLNTSFPSSLVEWALRRFFQILVHLIIRASKAAVTHPLTNVHAVSKEGRQKEGRHSAGSCTYCAI